MFARLGRPVPPSQFVPIRRTAAPRIASRVVCGEAPKLPPDRSDPAIVHRPFATGDTYRRVLEAAAAERAALGEAHVAFGRLHRARADPAVKDEHLPVLHAQTLLAHRRYHGAFERHDDARAAHHVAETARFERELEEIAKKPREFPDEPKVAARPTEEKPQHRG